MRQAAVNTITAGCEPEYVSVVFVAWDVLAAEPGISVAGGIEPGVDAVSAMLIRCCEYVDDRHTDSREAVLADSLARTDAHRGIRHPTGGLVLGPEHVQGPAGAGYGPTPTSGFSTTVRLGHLVRPVGSRPLLGRQPANPPTRQPPRRVQP